jgi:hypothetical protein
MAYKKNRKYYFFWLDGDQRGFTQDGHLDLEILKIIDSESLRFVGGMGYSL